MVAGHSLAYDQVTGFGLVLPLGRLAAPALELGSAESCTAGDEVIVVGQGGRAHALKARVIAKREFAGYWEYLLDEAIFTSPPHPQWGGAALIGEDGKLLGLGSLLVHEAISGEAIEGNMFVPIDLLQPVLDDMLKLGRSSKPPRPWLGMYTTEAEGRLVVGGLAPGGPAERAGVRIGDLVVEVGGERVSNLAEMLRRIWRCGPPGTEVPLTLGRDGALAQLKIRAGDRSDFLKKPQLH